MDKFRNYLIKANEWIGAHWRLVIWCLVVVIMMQQCTINRLQWEVTQLTQGVAAPLTQKEGPAIAHPADTLSATGDTATIANPNALTGPATEHETRNGWIIALVIAILVCGVIAYLYMRRNGIYPIGTSIRGKLKSDGAGKLTYWIRVKNNSRKQIEVAEPLVYFIMGGSSRKFRANVPQLPLTLDAGTSFETEINLSGLIAANMELCNAKAIGMSVSTNGKRHNTIPTPVRIKTA